MTRSVPNAVLRLAKGSAAALLAGLLWTGSSAVAQAPDAEVVAQREAARRLQDSDTLLALTSEGAVLYAQEKVKLSGYQYCSRAVALAEAGEFRQSARAASKAMHLAGATKDPNLLALANRDLAIVFSYAGQLDKAEQFAREALKHKVREPQLVVGPVQKVLGDVQMRRGDAAGAIASYEQALLGSSSRYRPLVQASLVNALIAAGDTGKARERLDALDAPKDATLRAQLDRTRARLLLAEKKPEQARDAYLKLTTSGADSDSSYFRVWAWDGVARSEIALGRKREAADAIGQALDGVDQVRAKFRSEEFKMGLFTDLQAVFDRGVDLYSDLGDARRAFEVSERSRSRALLDAVRGRAQMADDATAATGLATLQRLLRPDETVVEFHALPERLQIWVIDAQSIQGHSLALSKTALTEAVETFRNSIVRGRRAAISNADKLGQVLIAPLGLASGQRLIVVPHGPLHYLPFQALRVNGKYLIETHPMSISPSMSIAAQLASRSPVVEAKLTAFGNPRIADKYELPGAETEVRQLAQLFPDNQVFMGAQATKSNFRQVVSRSPVVHVAAHAEADELDPLYSRILLANEDGRQNFMEAHEVIGLDMGRTALVTLSACESGLGRVADGDEVLGFTRSFLAAGSSSLIVSLWPVADDATSVLMQTLYGDLRKGKDVQQAMQAGQLAVLARPGMAHPFFWAPFNLVGNWRLKVGN